jgi:hypothetical protein
MDYIVVSSVLKRLTTRCNEVIDCGSDHIAVVAVLDVSVKKRRRRQQETLAIQFNALRDGVEGENSKSKIKELRNNF